MAKRKTAKDVALEAEMLMAQAIRDKVKDRIKGDATAAPTDTEMNFLQTVIKNAQEAEHGEAVVAYLQDMETDELETYHDSLKKSLEEGEGLN